MSHVTTKMMFHIGTYIDTTQYSLEDPVYPDGAVRDAEGTIERIKKSLETYGEGKYINFVGLDISELEKVQEAFPNYNIWNTNEPKSTPYYHMRPK